MKIQMVLALAAWVINSTTIMAQETIKQTNWTRSAGEILLLNSRNLMMMYFSVRCGAVPTNSVCATGVWSPSLHLSVRGLPTISLTYHLQTAKQNGITRTEISEIITHIAFYAGWPKAWAAFRQAKEVWAEDITGEEAKAGFPARNDFPNRRTEYHICTILYRSELPGSGFEGTGAGIQCDL